MNVMQSIDEYLNTDSELVSLLDHDPSTQKIKIFRGVPFTTPTNTQEKDTSRIQFPYIVFDSTPFSMDLVKRQYRLKFSIVSDKLYLLENINARLQELLHFRNRKALTINELIIHNSQLVTGGSIFYHEDFKAYEQILYFLLTVKG